MKQIRRPWRAILLIYIAAFFVFSLRAWSEDSKTPTPASKEKTTTSKTKAPSASATIDALKSIAPKKKVPAAEKKVVKPKGKIRRIFAVLETSMGKIKIKLHYKRAPKSVDNFVGLAEGTKEFLDPKGKKHKKAYYDGLIFHRVINGFVIQGGCPTGNGRGGPGYTIPDELHPNLLHDKEGVVAMANTGAPNSAGSQFYISLGPLPKLDEKRPKSGYTVFGQVVEGMEVVKKIGKTKTNRMTDKPLEDAVIKKVTIERKYR